MRLKTTECYSLEFEHVGSARLKIEQLFFNLFATETADVIKRDNCKSKIVAQNNTNYKLQLNLET